MPHQITERIQLACRLAPAVATAIREYRFDQRIRTDTEALQRIIEAGMEKLQIPVEKQLKDLRHG